MDDFYLRMMNITAEEYRSLTQKPSEEKQKEICPYFLEGRCRYGESCWQYHPSEPLFEEEDDRECGICLLKVRSSNREYGLLMGCTHSFCLNCLRIWRGQLNVQKEVARACPICRTPSFYVVPSTVFIEDYQQKIKLAEQYKNKLAEIPCKFFNFGEGTCPFGSSCFYDHRYKNGKKWVPPPPIFQVNEYGEWGPAVSPKLSDFLDF